MPNFDIFIVLQGQQQLSQRGGPEQSLQWKGEEGREARGQLQVKMYSFLCRKTHNIELKDQSPW